MGCLHQRPGSTSGLTRQAAPCPLPVVCQCVNYIMMFRHMGSVPYGSGAYVSALARRA